MAHKEPSFADRLGVSAKAKRAQLDKARANAPENDPAFAERQAQRRAVAEARDKRAAERKAAKQAEEERKAAEREAEEIARQARLAEEAAEEAARAAALEAQRVEDLARAEAHTAERKAARDARYAARKARRK